MSRRWRAAGIAAVALCLASSIGAPDAGAGTGTRDEVRKVTFVARQCQSFADIAANRARNNIQESLEDLGVDSAYVGGDAVDPDVEAAQSPRCTPLPSWRFTLGRGIETRAVSGPWGSLSIVTDPFSTDILTRDSVPLLDSHGASTGRRIEGAYTLTLTNTQASLAATSSRLWVQGGTPADPVLFGQFPDRYAFGALRCAIDVLNGDNVEWISYPAGARHVFCFAYYVTPPPTSGTIVVRKAVDDPSVTARQAFPFQGDISYTPDGRFTLEASGAAAGTERFYRAGGRTWSWRELDVPGWGRVGLSCSSATGASTAATDLAAGTVSVALAAGDTVTCTHTNRPLPPPAGLTLIKRTLDGIGAFRFEVEGPESATQEITTEEEGAPVAGAPLELPAGDYEITERMPAADPSGRWQREDVSCDWRARSASPPLRVTLEAGRGLVCHFTNRFVPGGSIRIRKRTEGAAGTFGFLVRPVDDPSQSFEQRAETRRAGQTVTATGDDLSSLPLGRYEIVETAPAPSAGGHWRMESVVCDGAPRGGALGRTVVTLGRAAPHVTCTFVNRFVRAPEPELPEQPALPPPAEGGDVLVGGRSFGRPADLRISKRASARVVRLGRSVRYTVEVVNDGPGVALGVVASEVIAPGRTPLRLRATKGSCRGAPRPARCSLGTLRPGQRVRIAVDARPRGLGRIRNLVAVVSATDDPDLSNNRAGALVTALRPVAPRFTG